MGRPDADETVSALWIAHHYPEDYDRCVTVGRTHVCRRCLALYPVAFVVMVLTLGGARWPADLDAVLLVVLPLPSVVEFVAEHLGVIRYQPTRQVVLTVPLAVALGVGFGRYLRHPSDPLFWAIVVGYGGVCLAAVVIGARRRR
ncbi:MAG TPA: hypothetical protein VIJ47_10935 [Acidimicrobiales bacterium]